MSGNAGINKAIKGHGDFREKGYHAHHELFDHLKDKQHPEVLFITCSDSRIDPALITNTNPGDLFVCRNIGNIVPSYGGNGESVAAVLEYAIAALKVKDIIVCGHSDCGAMKALKTPDSPALAAMPAVQGWLHHADAAVSMVRSSGGNLSGDDLTWALIRKNVELQLQHLRTHRVVAAALAAGQLAVHGWVYDIGKGQVEVLDEVRHTFSPLEMPKGTSDPTIEKSTSHTK